MNRWVMLALVLLGIVVAAVIWVFAKVIQAALFVLLLVLLAGLVAYLLGRTKAA